MAVSNQPHAIGRSRFCRSSGTGFIKITTYRYGTNYLFICYYSCGVVLRIHCLQCILDTTTLLVPKKCTFINKVGKLNYHNSIIFILFCFRHFEITHIVIIVFLETVQICKYISKWQCLKKEMLKDKLLHRSMPGTFVLLFFLITLFIYWMYKNIVQTMKKKWNNYEYSLKKKGKRSYRKV